MSLGSSFQFPQEWGTEGVERGLHNSLRLLPWIPAPRLHEDMLRVHEDMLRENDMRRVLQGLVPAEGWGVSPSFALVSLRGVKRRSTLGVA